MSITPKYVAWVGAMASVILCGPVYGQSGSVQSGTGNGSGNWAAGPQEPARQLAAEAIQNEVKLIQYDHSYLRYRVHVKDAKGDQVREVIESKDGSVGRVMLRDEKTLSPAEDEQERERLQEMLDSPKAFERQNDKDKSGKKMAVDLIRMLPDAMVFQYVPGQPQREGKAPGAMEMVIDFKPNPEWKPPTMASQALTGIEGRCWIDEKSRFLTKIDVTVFQGINFGFGLLAHIYPGGKLSLEQMQVGDSRWFVDRFTGRLTVREMMVKTVSQNTDLFASEFVQIPEMGYRDAIRMLLNTPLPSAQASNAH